MRERGIRDELKVGLEKRALFERYPAILEMLASELYDEGKYHTENDVTVVRVPNGRL